MMWRLLSPLLLLSLPRLAHAADLGPLVEFGPIGNAIVAVGFLIGVGIIVWLGVGAFSAYKNRDLGGGMGEVMMNVGITVFAAVFLGGILVALIAPLRALGATP